MYYLAYGSNLHPHRLTLRVPSARHVGNVALPGMRLSFDKRSRDGSAKGMFTETGSANDVLYGAVYWLDALEKPILDEIEGLGSGYDETAIEVAVNGQVLIAFTYTAATTHIDTSLLPYEWYKELVILGAEYQRFPDAYIDRIKGVRSMQDTDSVRSERIGQLLATMRSPAIRN